MRKLTRDLAAAAARIHFQFHYTDLNGQVESSSETFDFDCGCFIHIIAIYLSNIASFHNNNKIHLSSDFTHEINTVIEYYTHKPKHTRTNIMYQKSWARIESYFKHSYIYVHRTSINCTHHTIQCYILAEYFVHRQA